VVLPDGDRIRADRAAALDAAGECLDDDSDDDPGYRVRAFKVSADPEAAS
jgi:hypothetical protein